MYYTSAMYKTRFLFSGYVTPKMAKEFEPICLKKRSFYFRQLLFNLFPASFIDARSLIVNNSLRSVNSIWSYMWRLSPIYFTGVEGTKLESIVWFSPSLVLYIFPKLAKMSARSREVHVNRVISVCGIR